MGSDILCPWTRQEVDIITLPLPLSGFFARGPFWQTRMFLTERDLAIVLGPRKGQPMQRKAGYAVPNLKCPFTGVELVVTEGAKPLAVTGYADGTGTIYQVRGPFWYTKWYEVKDHLLWDISQMRGVKPTFPKGVIGTITIVEPPEEEPKGLSTEQADVIHENLEKMLDTLKLQVTV